MRPMVLRGSEDPALHARIAEVHRLPGVRAGSSLLRVGNSLLAVQDDAWSIVWIALPGLSLRRQALRGDGGPLQKMLKPDFEAAVVTHDGIIHLLGSGATSNRCSIVSIAPERSTVNVREHPGLYQRIQQALGLRARPNIEGAIIVGGMLHLFHRGAGDSPCAWVEIPPAVLDGARPEIVRWQWLELGTLDGVALHVTDAAVVDPARVVLLAAAERTDDAIADGPVTGTALGFIEETAGVSWTRLRELNGHTSLRKCEGIVIDDDCRAAWVLTDPDDPARHAELLRVEIEGVA
jgi:hypothetical protein